jgi:hypothetical protein
MMEHGRAPDVGWSDAWAQASWVLKAEAERLRCESCRASIAYASRVAYLRSGLCELCEARQARASPTRQMGRSLQGPKSPLPGTRVAVRLCQDAGIRSAPAGTDGRLGHAWPKPCPGMAKQSPIVSAP